MCTVLFRFAPGARWPLLLGAIRDEFAERPWDPPARHWDGRRSSLVGGRDRTAGGTWLAVDPSPERPAVAALLNGARRPALDHGVRPTRGTLVLDLLATGAVPDEQSVLPYDGFHLLLATLDQVEVWSWDGEVRTHQGLAPGDHIIVNLGVDTHDDPLVPHFEPLLAAMPDPEPAPGLPTPDAWEPWLQLLAGDGLAPTDPRALLVHREIEGHVYASTSASLVALSPHGVRYDFNPVPTDATAWHEVDATQARPGPGRARP